MCPRFEEFEFCYVCAKYIKREHDRKPITSELEEMYQDIYNEEMNLSLLDSPESICAECESSFRNFVTGQTDTLRVKVPAKWGECKPDHSDCFFHLVKVDKWHNRTSLPKEGACFIPPVLAVRR